MKTRPDRYWTGFERFVAAMIDGLVVSAPLIILSGNWLFFLRSFISDEGLFLITLSIQQKALPVLIAILPIIYSIYMHYTYGQTIGKRVMSIKVVDVSENTSVSLKQAIQRDSIWIVLQIFDYVLEYYRLDGLHKLRMSDVNNVAIGWGMLELITMLTNSKRRAIHDFIAGTVVVKIQ